MINLRELKEKDAPLMIEWMHDQDFQKCFQKDMASISLDVAKDFCKKSKVSSSISEGDDTHFAIVNDKDEYMGTISLKSINLLNLCAEYSIVVRKCAQGNDVACQATKLLLDKAFYEYGLHRVYLNVLKDNVKAARFYQKCGFIYEGESRESILIDGEYKSLEWYSILRSDFVDVN